MGVGNPKRTSGHFGPKPIAVAIVVARVPADGIRNGLKSAAFQVLLNPPIGDMDSRRCSGRNGTRWRTPNDIEASGEESADERQEKQQRKRLLPVLCLVHNHTSTHIFRFRERICETSERLTCTPSP